MIEARRVMHDDAVVVLRPARALADPLIEVLQRRRDTTVTSDTN
jgi:hypothetical protein